MILGKEFLWELYPQVKTFAKWIAQTAWVFCLFVLFWGVSPFDDYLGVSIGMPEHHG